MESWGDEPAKDGEGNHRVKRLLLDLGRTATFFAFPEKHSEQLLIFLEQKSTVNIDLFTDSVERHWGTCFHRG